MKKLLIAFLTLAMVLSLAACGGKNEGRPVNTEPEGSGQTEPTKSDPPKTEPPETDPPKTDPPETDPPQTEPEGTEPQGSTPGIAGPGFPGIGGIGGVGGQGGETEDTPVADAGDLVDKLDALCAPIVEGSYCGSLRSSGEFSNYFGGAVQYTEGMRVAANHLQMAPPAHIVLLIEVPEGQNAEEYAKKLADNANPRWLVCATAQSVQYKVVGNLVLFVMTNEETANALIAAFNG